MVRPSLGVWLPDRPPSKSDAWLAGSALFLGIVSVPGAGTVAWPWMAIGFVANALILGLDASTVGQRFDDLLRAFGPAVRKAVGAAVILLLVFVFVEAVPEAIGRAVAVGGCAFVALSLTVNALFAVIARVDGARS